MKTDNSLLQAALFGYQSQIAEMEKAIAEIRRKLGGSSAGTPGNCRENRPAKAICRCPKKDQRRAKKAVG